MPTSRVVVSIDRKLLAELDRLIKDRVFANRSQAFQMAIREKLSRVRRTRLARECAKLDPAEEKALAEEGISGAFSQCPEY